MERVMGRYLFGWVFGVGERSMVLKRVLGLVVGGLVVGGMMVEGWWRTSRVKRASAAWRAGQVRRVSTREMEMACVPAVRMSTSCRRTSRRGRGVLAAREVSLRMRRVEVPKRWRGRRMSVANGRVWLLGDGLGEASRGFGLLFEEAGEDRLAARALRSSLCVDGRCRCDAWGASAAPGA